jgi:hypothetical protein
MVEEAKRFAEKRARRLQKEVVRPKGGRGVEVRLEME